MFPVFKRLNAVKSLEVCDFERNLIREPPPLRESDHCPGNYGAQLYTPAQRDQVPGFNNAQGNKPLKLSGIHH
jgi:hypothetical protein